MKRRLLLKRSWCRKEERIWTLLIANSYMSGWSQHKVVNCKCAFNFQMRRRNHSRPKMDLRVSNRYVNNNYSQFNSKLMRSKMIKMAKTFFIIVSKIYRGIYNTEKPRMLMAPMWITLAEMWKKQPILCWTVSNKLLSVWIKTIRYKKSRIERHKLNHQKWRKHNLICWNGTCLEWNVIKFQMTGLCSRGSRKG